MISKRVTSFFRRITVCLTVSTMIVLFALSCQKDDGIKQKDPNALTKPEAKAYFEQTATTLKFLTATSGPAETKNQDYSLTENMVIEWEQALEGETADSYVVEIPIRMVSPVSALLYDGIGHLNKNIRQVQINTSLIIKKHRTNGLFNYSLVHTIGKYTASITDSKYGFLSDKQSFNGYQIFSDEEGVITSSLLYTNGKCSSVALLYPDQLTKVDTLGIDFLFSGIKLKLGSVQTKGDGGGFGSGEDSVCPFCGHVLVYSNDTYMCPICIAYFQDLIGVMCPDCHEYIPNCLCVCQICGFPNRYGNTCLCGDHCPYCGENGCNGECESGVGNQNIPPDTFTITTTTNNDQGGFVTRSTVRSFYYYNEYITLTAYSYSGFSFTGWYENNVLVCLSNEYGFVVTGDRNLVARFE